MKKLRRLGDITSDLEHLLDELYIAHDMQLHEVLGLLVQTTKVHYPESIEVYDDNSNPILYYGHKDGIK